MEKNIKLTSEVHAMLDQGLYADAKTKVLRELDFINKEEKDYPVYLAEIAGLLIDIGSENRDFEAAEKGLELLKYKQIYEKHIGEESYFYNLGNAYEAMQKAHNHSRRLPSVDGVRLYIVQAKNNYYRAFRKIDFKKSDSLSLKILTNLGNNLSCSGRIVEAIQLYNKVLSTNPNFVHAQLGMAENLGYWHRISFCPKTIYLYVAIYSLYEKAFLHKKMPPERASFIETKISEYTYLLKQANYSFNSLKSELDTNEKEYNEHTDFRKYCLDNFLALNEHSLYCKCYSASKDNLSIGHPNLDIYHEKLAKMELLLNRLKSEFSLVRKLYYEGIVNPDNDNETSFNELMDNEVIGESSEKIRTSFRMCFSIFDRIAHGICYFFDLNAEKEHIYFERFWEKPKIWAKIKDKQNPHMVALYSIANDFNFKQNGEFRFYKEWRNKLEHNNIVLVNSVDSPDLLKLFNDESFVTKIPFNLFKEEALHLLQICCASIYSYTYLIRTETICSNAKPSGKPYTVSPKLK